MVARPGGDAAGAGESDMSDGKIIVAALIWRDSRILICQRAQSAAFPLKWEFPGGKVEAGETPETALRRELSEELGIDAEIGPLSWTTQYQYDGYSPITLRFYEVRAFRGEVVNKIFRQIRWATPSELPAFDFLEADQPLVERLARNPG